MSNSFGIYTTQRPMDYEEVGSKTIEPATGMTEDIILFFGHHDEATANQVAERYKLSPEEKNFIQNSRPGEWLVMIGGETSVLFTTNELT